MWLRPALPPADEVENNYEYDTILEADAENLQKVRRAIERDRGRGELAEVRRATERDRLTDADWVVLEKVHGSNFSFSTNGKAIEYHSRRKKPLKDEPSKPRQQILSPLMMQRHTGVRQKLLLGELLPTSG